MMITDFCPGRDYYLKSQRANRERSWKIGDCHTAYNYNLRVFIR